jgi:hypothetical protein
LPPLLGLPSWHWHVRAVLQYRELSYWIGQTALEPDQRRRARAHLLRMYGRRKANRMRRGLAKVDKALGPQRRLVLGRSR